MHLISQIDCKASEYTIRKKFNIVFEDEDFRVG